MRKEKTRKKKSYRFPLKLAGANEMDAKQMGETEQDWVEKACKQRLKSKKEYQMLGLKLIPIKCRATCLKCKRLLEVGEYALYGRTGDVICIECHALRHGDKALAHLMMKKVQYTRAVKVLKKLTVEYAERVDLYMVGDKLIETDKRRNEILTLVEEFVRTQVGTREERQAIENMMRRDEQLSQYCHDLERYIGDKIVKLLKKKKKAYPV